MPTGDGKTSLEFLARTPQTSPAGSMDLEADLSSQSAATNRTGAVAKQTPRRNTFMRSSSGSSRSECSPQQKEVLKLHRAKLAPPHGLTGKKREETPQTESKVSSILVTPLQLSGVRRYPANHDTCRSVRATTPRTTKSVSKLVGPARRGSGNKQLIRNTPRAQAMVRSATRSVSPRGADSHNPFRNLAQGLSSPPLQRSCSVGHLSTPVRGSQHTSFTNQGEDHEHEMHPDLQQEHDQEQSMQFQTPPTSASSMRRRRNRKATTAPDMDSIAATAALADASRQQQQSSQTTGNSISGPRPKVNRKSKSAQPTNLTAVANAAAMASLCGDDDSVGVDTFVQSFLKPEAQSTPNPNSKSKRRGRGRHSRVHSCNVGDLKNLAEEILVSSHAAAFEQPKTEFTCVKNFRKPKPMDLTPLGTDTGTSTSTSTSTSKMRSLDFSSAETKQANYQHKSEPSTPTTESGRRGLSLNHGRSPSGTPTAGHHRTRSSLGPNAFDFDFVPETMYQRNDTSVEGKTSVAAGGGSRSSSSRHKQRHSKFPLRIDSTATPFEAKADGVAAPKTPSPTHGGFSRRISAGFVRTPSDVENSVKLADADTHQQTSRGAAPRRRISSMVHHKRHSGLKPSVATNTSVTAGDEFTVVRTPSGGVKESKIGL